MPVVTEAQLRRLVAQGYVLSALIEQLQMAGRTSGQPVLSPPDLEKIADRAKVLGNKKGDEALGREIDLIIGNPRAR